MNAPVYVVKGSDTALVASAGTNLVHRLVGDEDPSYVVEHFEGEEADPSALASACAAAPFLAPIRVVLVRQAGALSPQAVAGLLDYLANPVETTSVVLLSGGGTISQKLVTVARKLGEVVDADPPRGKGRDQWLAAQIATSGVRLDGEARQLLSEHLGGDVARLEGLMESLAATYGTAKTLRSDDVRPYLGEAGDIPPWDLTDAVDNGARAEALAALHRMLDGGGRHPLAVMAVLHRHYAAALRLEGSGVATEAAAGEVLGASPFAARKSLMLSRKLGFDGIARAIELLADADVDLRGRSGLPGEVVMEILVARLARLGASAPRRSNARQGRSPLRH